MNIFEKIKRSWWVILSFVAFLNGTGFIYIGTKHNNKNWILEGIAYEIPWFLYFVYFAIFGNPNLDFLIPSSLILLLALIAMFVSIVRSVWVAVKLIDVYDNVEKYTIQSTVLDNKGNAKENKNLPADIGCCLCIIAIFFIFLIIVL